MTNIEKIENAFKDKALLKKALTHRSWVNENKGKRGTNERLEFLGDAILEFVVSKKIFTQYPKKEEGYLTALRSNLVNTTNLSRVALKLDVGNSLFLSRGEEEGGGRENISLLADTIEAIIGALFIDGGLERAEKFIETNILNNLEEVANSPLKDDKSLLQEVVQSKGFPTPKYKVVEEKGPDHSKSFTVEVMVGKKPYAKGAGKSKSIAEQKAAKNALNTLEIKAPKE